MADVSHGPLPALMCFWRIGRYHDIRRLHSGTDSCSKFWPYFIACQSRVRCAGSYAADAVYLTLLMPEVLVFVCRSDELNLINFGRGRSLR